MIKKFKQWLSAKSWEIKKKRTLLVFPLFYISYIFYIRIILVRLDRILYVSLSLDRILIIGFILGLLFWRIYVLLQKQQLIQPKETKNFIIIWFKTKMIQISWIFNDLWFGFYKAYLRDSRILAPVIFVILRVYHFKLPNNLFYRNLIILIIFEILPKIIVLMTFLLDVFYFYKFHYVYKTMVLLLLPLIFRTIKILLLLYYKDYYPATVNCFDLTETYDKDGDLAIKFTLKDNMTFGSGIKNLQEYFTKYFKPLLSIPEILEEWSNFMLKYKIYLLFIFFLLLHIIGWLTILIYGIFLV